MNFAGLNLQFCVDVSNAMLTATGKTKVDK